jgi:hypothetical protein
MPLLSIVIPFVPGREGYLDLALRAYRHSTPVDTQILVITGKATCGEAWNQGIEQADGDYVLLAADDIEPADDGWLETGIHWVNNDVLPCARILNTDGTLQSCGDWPEEAETGTICEFARIPFARSDQMQAIYPILPIHYATDYWFSHRGREIGLETMVVRDFCFYHHFAQPGRQDYRLASDMQIFRRKAGHRTS